MKNIIMYAHGGSGNHGCEAIVRSTAAMFPDKRLSLMSRAVGEDEKFGIGEICDIKPEFGSYRKASPEFLSAYLALKLKKDYIPLDMIACHQPLRSVKRGDIALSIGGDNYCYENVYGYVYLHGLYRKRGEKTVLWGCSVEPELLNDKRIAADLASYDLITARESITYEALKKLNPNTVAVTDPAFGLETVTPQLPEGFEIGNTVGINLSPLVKKSEKVPGITLENYKTLVARILETTDMKIALIPHVVWEGNDDRAALAELSGFFPGEKRIITFPEMGCREIKGVISKCRFFIGARTHSTIAAYSSSVPTLVVGYSVKARGIARDLFGSENGCVLPVQGLKEKHDLAQAFEKIAENENGIKNHLSTVMPEWKRKAAVAGEMLNKLIEEIDE